MPDSAPLVRKLTTTLPALTAGTAGDQTLGEAPYAGTVSDVSFTPEAAITGDNTNKRTFTLVNKGQAGSGSTVIATLDFVTGVNGVAFDEKQFTLSGTAANLVVASGDILAVVEAVAGTGLANPGGLVQVEITRS
jgi:hypothetical protein